MVTIFSEYQKSTADQKDTQFLSVSLTNTDGFKQIFFTVLASRTFVQCIKIHSETCERIHVLVILSIAKIHIIVTDRTNQLKDFENLSAFENMDNYLVFMAVSVQICVCVCGVLVCRSNRKSSSSVPRHFNNPNPNS